MFPRTCLDAAGASCLLSWSSGKATCWLSEKIQTVKHCLVFHCLSTVLRIKIRWRRGLLCSCLRCKTLYVPVWVASLESASAESDAQGFAEHDGFFFCRIGISLYYGGWQESFSANRVFYCTVCLMS